MTKSLDTISPVGDPDFSLVVLCYRSGKSVVPFIESLCETLSYCNLTWELVLVGNYIEGTSDETPAVVQALAQSRPNIKAVVRPKVGMMGWDMPLALIATRAEYISVIGGDAPHGGRDACPSP